MYQCTKEPSYPIWNSDFYYIKRGVWFVVAFFFFFFFFCFLGLHLQCMEVPEIGVKSELQLLAYTIAIATVTLDPSCICSLNHSSGQHQILNPLSKARMEPTTSWLLVRFFSVALQWELLLLQNSWCQNP